MFVSSFFGCKKTFFFAKDLPNETQKQDAKAVI